MQRLSEFGDDVIGKYHDVQSFVLNRKGHSIITKILLANNGMAAVKAMKSIQKWSYETFGNEKAISFVAMVTPEDLNGNAEYIRMADHFIEVPSGSANNNYANIDLILELAERCEVDAVWVGWGYASENPLLPEKLAQASHKLGRRIHFIGPPASAIRALGDKISSTIVAQSARVPCIQWSGSHVAFDIANMSHPIVVPDDLYRKACVTEADEAFEVAKRIGFPVMIKASEGGGGKGIRLVRDDNEKVFQQHFRGVQQEVVGSPIFLMKVAEAARHLEVQILADQHGQTISIFGRDCSVQRRHQKIIEEAPITAAPPFIVEQMEQAATCLATLVGYVSAGTVEYLYNPTDNSFFFLELNPRLQVEHPTTEMVSGVNLPAAQLQIAMGIPLHCIKDIRLMYGLSHSGTSKIDFTLAQPESKEWVRKPSPKGHVIAARITAENPELGFKPTSGRLFDLNFRSQNHVWGYFSVGSLGGIHEYADSQFGHIFSYGSTREESRRNMILALKELSIRGEFRTTVHYLVRLLEKPEFAWNSIHTGWLDQLLLTSDQLSQPPLNTTKLKGDDVWAVPAICGAVVLGLQQFQENLSQYKAQILRGQIPPASLLATQASVELILFDSKFRFSVLAANPMNNLYVLSWERQTFISVSARMLSDGSFLILLDGKSHVVYAKKETNSVVLDLDKQTYLLEKDRDPSKLRTSSPGKLVRWCVEEKDSIVPNQTVAELEVMKMVLPITASHYGVIKPLKPAGTVVQAGDILAVLDIDKERNSPETLKTAMPFSGKFPAFGPPEAISSKLHHLFVSALATVTSVLHYGFNNSFAAKRALSDLVSISRNPLLPFSQLEHLLSTLSGRITSTVANVISQKLSQANATSFIDPKMGHFPASALLKYLESVPQSESIDKIVAAISPYKNGIYEFQRHLLARLLWGFYEVEKSFENRRVDEAVARIKESFSTTITPTSDGVNSQRNLSPLCSSSPSNYIQSLSAKELPTSPLRSGLSSSASSSLINSPVLGPSLLSEKGSQSGGAALPFNSTQSGNQSGSGMGISVRSLAYSHPEPSYVYEHVYGWSIEWELAEQIAFLVRSHLALSAKTPLVLTLLEHVRSLNNGLPSWKAVFVPILRKLAKLHSDFNEIALRAKELLVYSLVPTIEERSEDVQRALAAAINPPSLKLDFEALRPLAQANHAIVDVLPNFFFDLVAPEQSKRCLRLAALVTYVLHAYQAFQVELGDLLVTQHTYGGLDEVSIDWKFTLHRGPAAPLVTEKTVEGINALSLEKSPKRADHQVVKRFGLLLTFNSLEHLESTWIGRSVAAAAGKPEPYKVLSLMLPYKAVLKATRRNDGTATDDYFAKMFTLIINKSSRALVGCGVSRVTIVLTKRNGYPFYFTFRPECPHRAGDGSPLRSAYVSSTSISALQQADDDSFESGDEAGSSGDPDGGSSLKYGEDTLIRHLEPAMAYQLELTRLCKFQVTPCHLHRACPDGDGSFNSSNELSLSDTSASHSTSFQRFHIHIYRGTALSNRLDHRFFVRALVYPGNFGRSVSTKDFLTSEGHRLMTDVMNALELLSHGGKMEIEDDHDCNHIFLSFIPAFQLKLEEVEEAIRVFIGRHGIRLFKLRVTHGELRFLIKTTADGVVRAYRFHICYVSGLVMHVDTYIECTAEELEQSLDQIQHNAISYYSDLRPLFLKSISNLSAPLHRTPVFTPYATKEPVQPKRYKAHLLGTTYAYDYPELLREALASRWRRFSPDSKVPSTLLTYEELVLNENNELVTTDRSPGLNTVGMVAWKMSLWTPEIYPESRTVIVLANDITFLTGSFGPLEDLVFYKVTKLAQSLKCPRIYMAANSGARIGLADDVMDKFCVKWTDESAPERGFDYLYVTESDRELLSSSVQTSEIVLPDGKVIHRIESIVGASDGLGVENLRGSAMIAGATSEAYNDIFTITLVSCRSVGIGAYLVRLGQRAIQVQHHPIILTGAGALNKVLGREVYTSNLQLGGTQIMYRNGISHLVVPNELDGAKAIFDWLSFVPNIAGGDLPVCQSRADPADRTVEVPLRMETGFSDAYELLTGSEDGKRGLLDSESFMETLGGWAKGVIVGRGRIGGLPIGVIAVNTFATTTVIPADPASSDSTEQSITEAGQVWYPNSAFKTAQAIRDFNNGEQLPLLILANWRGFSGGQSDMFKEILKFGSLIVDALREFRQPVLVYNIGELRGGAWVVLDPTINPDQMHMFAETNARGGVLEPEGVVQVKYRRPRVIATMKRLDSKLQDPSAPKSLKEQRESLLFPVFQQVAHKFADLHDTAGRMLAKGVIEAIIPWKQSRTFLYNKLRRLLLEKSLAKMLVDRVYPEESYSQAVQRIGVLSLALHYDRGKSLQGLLRLPISEVSERLQSLDVQAREYLRDDCQFYQVVHTQRDAIEKAIKIVVEQRSVEELLVKLKELDPSLREKLFNSFS